MPSVFLPSDINPVTDLVIDGETITTTEDHPFWSVTDNQYEPANQLAPGEQVLAASGHTMTVTGLQPTTSRQAPAYNLTVQGIPTYHIGHTQTLVHNCGHGVARADSAMSAVGLQAQLAGEEIASGHSFAKHVVDGGEFAGISTRSQFADHIDDVILNGEMRPLGGGRSAYWSDGTIVIRNPGVPDGGTAFAPTAGYQYFLTVR